MDARGNASLGARLRRDDGSVVTLDVECNVSGQYRPAKTSGDPDSCYEAESPEIEPVSAKWSEIEDDEGEARNPGEGESDAFDLNKLSRAENSRLIDALYKSLQNHGADDRDHDPEPYDDDDGWQVAQDRWERGQGI